MQKMENSIDCVIFGFENTSLKVLLITRRHEPQKGLMALPGDFIQVDEDIDASANRILKQITNLSDIYLEQIRAFGTVDRYPGKRVLTIGYYALVNIEKYSVKAGHTAESVDWYDVDDLPPLAFDHKAIILAAHKILKRKVRHEPIGFNLLSEKFTLTELQHLYEAILQITLNKRNFRTKLNQMKLLVDTGEKQTNVSHKPAKFYKFDSLVYEKLVKDGFYFKI